MADNLSGIDLFVTVVEAGSFSVAAERMGITRSAVGKGIVRLENRLGIPLFTRTTRSQSLTDEGAMFYRYCQRAVEEIRAGEAALESAQWSVRGRLRVSMPVLFGHLCIAPILLELAQEHPDLVLDMSFSDRVVDLEEEGYDLVIRNGASVEGEQLLSRRLGEHRMTYCASVDYLKTHGQPSNQEELLQHDGVAYARQGRVIDWQVMVAGQVQAIRPKFRLQMDDLSAVADAAIAGFGIAWLPSWLARKHLENGELVEVLAGSPSVVFPISAVWPQTQHLPLKTRTVVDELELRLPARLAAVER